MSGARPRVRRIITGWLGKSLRVPGTGLAFPLWGLAAVAVAVFTPIGGAALWVSNQPIFCNSCHEMSMHYATWSQSAHSDVTCEECHLMPGAINMFKTKLAAIRQMRRHAGGDVKTSIIQGHVPEENCRRCHPETRELVTYHGLQITHAAHWEMGLECTFCHDRVAHGTKWQFEGVTSAEQFTNVAAPSKYAPTMETCYTCHDGNQAPNDCSTCHVTLGERRPTTFDPAWIGAHQEEVRRSGEEDCYRCHQDTFCDRCHREADPHTRDWTIRHPEEAESDPDRCAVCHLVPGETRPRDISQLAFCRDCHSLRREHGGTDWVYQHGRESLGDPVSCRRCHQPSWCTDCHAFSRPHPAEWQVRHAAEATQDTEGCAVCHPSDFCDVCHSREEGTPTSHETGWLTRHKEGARAGERACQTCHQPDFCGACHARHAPENHGPLWLSQHGVTSEAGETACLICHEQDFCGACHETEMPHAPDWLGRHFAAAARGEARCELCHREEGCAMCHRGALPSSHGTSDWLSHHGASAWESEADCMLCHRTEMCSSCHGVDIPHPVGWGGGPHGAAAHRGDAVCVRCHSQDECQACHGLPMPHPEGWTGEHGARAQASADTCARCHAADAHDCNSCHAALAPPTHREQGWDEQHGLAGAGAMDLCTLCHGENSCVDCHARRTEAAA